MMETILFFTYGTFKRGQCRHHILLEALATFVQEAEVKGFTLYDVHGHYPAAVPSPTGSIKGELYTIPQSLLRELDAIEGTPHLYRRIEMPTTDGQICTMYSFQRSVDGLTPCGEVWP